MKITLVAGARPNFIKIAPLIDEIKRRRNLGDKISYRLVHTGQHYDDAMSGQFFKELNIPQPDINLNCSGQTQAEQTASILVAFERELLPHPCDIVLVVGDVNSTMACAISAKKLNIPVAHVEAGIRSFDDCMPEEINRKLTDAISDLCFTTTQDAKDFLIQSGHDENKVFFVGNVMIDSLLKHKSSFTKPDVFTKEKLEKKKYWVMTLHRPSNVDDQSELNLLIEDIINYIGDQKLIFPMHPRTRKAFGLEIEKHSNLIITEPLGYLEFNYLVENALGVLTDSGGITEETSVMGVPCISLRENTERPETIKLGTNVLAGQDRNKINNYIQKIQENNWKKGNVIPYWDGKASARIIQQLLNS